MMGFDEAFNGIIDSRIKGIIDDKTMALMFNALSQYRDLTKADGCVGCAFETNTESWELPCSDCSKNHKNYWRKAK